MLLFNFEVRKWLFWRPLVTLALMLQKSWGTTTFDMGNMFRN